MGGCFFVKKMKTIKGVLPQRTKPQEIVLEEYLLQKVIGMLYDKIAQFHDFAPKVWDEEVDECVTCKYFYDILIYVIL